MHKGSGASLSKHFSADLNWNQPPEPERHVQLEFTLLHGRRAELPAGCTLSKQVLCSRCALELVSAADAKLQPHDGLPISAAIPSSAATESSCRLPKLSHHEWQPQRSKLDQPVRRCKHDHQRQPVRPHATSTAVASISTTAVQSFPDSTTPNAWLCLATARRIEFLELRCTDLAFEAVGRHVRWPRKSEQPRRLVAA